MTLPEGSALVTGGASGLGLATARRLHQLGMRVTIADLATSAGVEVARDMGARFVAADVTEPGEVRAAAAVAAGSAPLRAVVHTAGRGGPIRIIDRDGRPGDSEKFAAIVRTNLVGTFNVVSAAAEVMSGNELDGQDRGAIVLTASVAAFEGQIGQVAYAASKAGVVGFTLTAARDLASRAIRLCTIAPGIFDTPMLATLRDDVRASLAEAVPHPHRLGAPDDYADLAVAILSNEYLNGETLRLDGAIRMPPR